jgi:hypothetical protein
MFDIYLAHDSHIYLARDSFIDVLRHLGPDFIMEVSKATATPKAGLPFSPTDSSQTDIANLPRHRNSQTLGLPVLSLDLNLPVVHIYRFCPYYFYFINKSHEFGRW